MAVQVPLMTASLASLLDRFMCKYLMLKRKEAQVTTMTDHFTTPTSLIIRDARGRLSSYFKIESKAESERRGILFFQPQFSCISLHNLRHRTYHPRGTSSYSGRDVATLALGFSLL